MRFVNRISTALLCLLNVAPRFGHGYYNISFPLFAELEELSRIVDISYCVGSTGIYAPFSCVSRCSQFEDFELIDTWNTGILMSDSCGYVVLDHRKSRIIAAFRGTAGIRNTIMDLSTVPQEYIPYPGDLYEDPGNSLFRHFEPRPWRWRWFRRTGHRRHSSTAGPDEEEGPKCTDCTVHYGFYTTWKDTRSFIVPYIEHAKDKHPDYALHLVGHSLGGAVAALAGLEFEAQGFHPTITTFGEPRVGNAGLRNYIDEIFQLDSAHQFGGRYRRITHVDDPVPLLPLTEWGFRMHAGEVYISKASLQPGIDDVRLCEGDEDKDCIYGAEGDRHSGTSWRNALESLQALDDPEALDLLALEDFLAENSFSDAGEERSGRLATQRRWSVPIPARYKVWQLLFAHRDYFWRLGLCLPGGDPGDYWRPSYPGAASRDAEREDL